MNQGLGFREFLKFWVLYRFLLRVYIGFRPLEGGLGFGLVLLGVTAVGCLVV